MSLNVSLVWVPVSDMARSVDFFENTLGLTRLFSSDDWTEFKVGAIHLSLHGPNHRQGKDRPAPGNGGVVVFRVGDLLTLRGKLEGKGVKFLGTTEEQPYGLMADFVDPDGNRFQLFQAKH
ncbi:MAG: hypothetical protein COX57_09330 [Alphaproteobacteria bacterium CG_4_10_14_0_2_um_filter_63_37]|nr:MAG: hypothetical protein AUJ55_02335 [Proteobacteria bacterium CG1_02_64_396]PJA24264.1 MAG: hypothetical protein COX57_09330 [Alphaproteobacteria bacterium CG_4_10_14_0_2_um_filter_63_37]